MKINVMMLFLLCALAKPAMAQDCQCDHVQGTQETLFKIESGAGRTMRLRFATNPVTTRTNTAFLCTEPDATITLAKLWMPVMGHGSAPTQLTSSPSGCTRIDHMQFIMNGAWELQIKTTDDDAGKFSIPVANPSH